MVFRSSGLQWQKKRGTRGLARYLNSEITENQTAKHFQKEKNTEKSNFQVVQQDGDKMQITVSACRKLAAR